MATFSIAMDDNSHIAYFKDVLDAKLNCHSSKLETLDYFQGRYNKNQWKVAYIGEIYILLRPVDIQTHLGSTV